MSQEEKEYYRNGNVLVTNTRAELGDRTFVMANVTAVSMTTRPANYGFAGVLLLVGAIFILSGFVGIPANGLPALFIGLTLGLILCSIGFVWFRSLKPTYSVHLGSASGE